MYLQLYSNGIVGFLSRMMENSKCISENGTSDLNKSSETTESTIATDNAETSNLAVPDVENGAKETEKSDVRSNPEAHVESDARSSPHEPAGHVDAQSAADKAMGFAGFVASVTPPNGSEPAIISIGSPKAADSAESVSLDANETTDATMLLFYHKFTQTNDESAVSEEDALTNAIQPIEAVLRLPKNRSECELASAFKEASTQTTEIDEEMVPIQFTCSDSTETLVSPNSVETVRVESVESSPNRDIDKTVATGESAEEPRSTEPAGTLDSALLNSMWTPPLSVEEPKLLEEKSNQSDSTEEERECTEEESPAKRADEEGLGNSVEKENGPQPADEDIFAGLGEAKKYAQLTSVELSSTSFTLEEASFVPDDTEEWLQDYQDWLNAAQVDQAAPVANFGDFSSTNNVSFGGSNLGDDPTENVDPNLTKSMEEIVTTLLDDLQQGDKSPAQSDTCDAAKPGDPQTVATSQDSTGDGLPLQTLPCAVIIPHMEKKYPQYAHLLRPLIKRKAHSVEDSALKKKFRTELNDKIPLGAFRNVGNHHQPLAQPQRPEKSRLRGDFSSAFKRPKPKKRKNSKEARDSRSSKTSSNPPKDVSMIFPSSADFSRYQIPKIKVIAPVKPAARAPSKENIPKHDDSISRREDSDVKRQDSDSQLREVGPKQRNSTLKDVESTLKLRGSALKPRESKSDRKNGDILKGGSKSHSDPTKMVNSRPKPSSSKLEETSQKIRLLSPKVATSPKHRAPSPKPKSRIESSLKCSNNRPTSKETTSKEMFSRPKPCDQKKSDSVGMPSLEPIVEPVNPNIGSSSWKTSESAVLPASAEAIASKQDLRPSPEKRPDLKERNSQPAKGILKNRGPRRSSQLKARFKDNHCFKLFESEEQISHPSQCTLLEPPILDEINQRYSKELNIAKLCSLKWIHQCWEEKESIQSCPEDEPKFDCYDCTEEFEQNLKKMIHSRLRRVISEIEFGSIRTNTFEFFIDIFDTSAKDDWKIVLKRDMDSKESEQIEVGQVVSLILFTKKRKLNGSWKEKLIFGYIEEIVVQAKDDRQLQKISVSVHPIEHEVKRDVQVKVEKIVRMLPNLRLLSALSVIPYSSVVELFTSSFEKLNSSTSSVDDLLDKIIESEQVNAVEFCNEKVLAENPFLFFVDGAPGTGKSHFITKLIQKLYSNEVPDFLKILIIAHSDASADDILHRLTKLQSQNLNILRYSDGKTTHPLLKAFTLSDANYILQKPNLTFDLDLEKRIFQASKNAKDINTEISVEFSEKNLTMKKEKITNCINDPATASTLKRTFVKDTTISSSDVIIISRDACYNEDFFNNFTPCSSRRGEFNRFTLCIIDDAHEMTEADMLIPIMTMVSNLILIGDSKNPTLQDVSSTPFTRLLEKCKKTSPKNVANFKTQFRLHPKIVDCMGKMSLFVNSTTEMTEQKLALKPFMVVDLTCSGESLDYSKQFERQAQLCKNITQSIREIKELQSLRIGVLVGKKKQKSIVKQELKHLPEILVDKAAGYRGLEKDVMIVCIPPLLFPEQFLYTAMTRAKRCLIICADFAQFKGQEKIEQLILHATRRRCFQRWDKNPSEFPFGTMRLFLKVKTST